MTRRIVLGVVVAAAALAGAPAATQAADAELTGLTSRSGPLFVAGSVVASADDDAVAVLNGAAFKSTGQPSWPKDRGEVLDLGTDKSDKPVLVRKDCARGVGLCFTPLNKNAPITAMQPIDPAHCTTTGAAVWHGRQVQAVVARKGKPGQSCAAGIYEGRRRRIAVKHWAIGNPVGLQELAVKIDLTAKTALVQIEQFSFDNGDSGDRVIRLQIVALPGWRARTIATVEDDGSGVAINYPMLGPDGVYAVAECGAPSSASHSIQAIRWPLTGGLPDALQPSPVTDPAQAVPTPDGLIVVSSNGKAQRISDPPFSPLSFSDPESCPLSLN